ncbi:MAG: high-potential iron-sulfur protein [Betaproteobacteria bacterium]|nr:high-potential iron-sulfur protein [Betaproteobacteria bacterium]
MKRSRINVQRRGFLKAGSLAVASLAMGSRAGISLAQAKKPHLDESDPQAEKLGYKHDATKVDKKKSPTYKPGETCGNCQLFQGKPDKDEWAPCPIFPGKQVNVKGWCSSYTKKISS